MCRTTPTHERCPAVSRAAAVLFSVLALSMGTAYDAHASEWKPLARDGIHDPESPAVDILQEPAEALSELPGDTTGNRVRWVEALEEGFIEPRTNILPDTEIKVLDEDVLMEDTAEMPIVRFPHKPHTEWLACDNCHERLFRSKKGETPVNMFAILQGEYCGRCHGAVAFPLTECNRCHSVPRK